MADNFEQDLKGLQSELMPMVNKLQSQLVQSLESIEKNCIDQSKNDVDRFVECKEKKKIIILLGMLKRTKKIEKEEKRFQFKLSYMQNVTQNCFKQAVEKGTTKDVCKSAAKDNLDRYLKELMNAIKQ